MLGARVFTTCIKAAKSTTRSVFVLLAATAKSFRAEALNEMEGVCAR